MQCEQSIGIIPLIRSRDTPANEIFKKFRTEWVRSIYHQFQHTETTDKLASFRQFNVAVENYIYAHIVQADLFSLKLYNINTTNVRRIICESFCWQIKYSISRMRNILIYAKLRVAFAQEIVKLDNSNDNFFN